MAASVQRGSTLSPNPEPSPKPSPATMPKRRMPAHKTSAQAVEFIPMQPLASLLAQFGRWLSDRRHKSI